MIKWKKEFRQHKARAKYRNIKWKLTFEEWLKIWEESGHIDERGRTLGKYQMCRKGDKGAYEVGNVRIMTTEENLKEKWEMNPTPRLKIFPPDYNRRTGRSKKTIK
jgi:hypothetical protein